MKKVTLKDIANELNITVGTVSHVMSGIDDISKETKNKVIETAKRLGYIPNHAASSLRTGKTNTVAIIVPDISNPHIAYQVKQIEYKMKQHNYSAIILNTNENDALELDAIHSACNKQVDGIFLCPAQHSTKNIEFLNKIEIPYILIGRYFSELDTDYVCADDKKGGYLAGRYLLDNEYKNPVYIGVHSYIQSNQNRLTGLKQAFNEYGIIFPEKNILQIDSMPNNISDAITTIKERNLEFDSSIVFSDVLAFSFSVELKKHAFPTIPVIGFDAICSHLCLPFKNISIGMVDGGWAKKASKILINKIKGDTESHHELIDVQIFDISY